MRTVTDQTGRTIQIKEKPLRIVSTVPSQTELLYTLGLEEETLGITAYCVHPAHWISVKTVIGGTKNLNIDRIRELKPDLIIGNKEENVKEQIEELARDIPLWLSDVNTVDSALEMIRQTGIICNRTEKAEDLIKTITKERQDLRKFKNIHAVYLIWKDPYMVAGEDTFISHMLREGGIENKVKDHRYPEITIEALKKDPPHLLFLSSEPYAFNVSDMHYLGKELPGTLIKIVDGEMFSWYGSRLLHSFKYLKRIILELEVTFLK